MSEQQQQQQGPKRARIAAPARRAQSSEGGEIVQGQPVDSDQALRDVGEALGRVYVGYGAYGDYFDVAGKTVEYVREHLSHLYNIPEEALPVIGGTPVESLQRQLMANERLEFIHDAGEKG